MTEQDKENSAKETERIFSGSAEEILDSLESTNDAYYHHSQIEPVITQLQEALKELIPIAEQFSDNYPVSATVLRVKQVIEKAKKLIP